MLKLEVLSGGLSGRTFQFDKTEVRLGRHPACEVVFDSTRDDSVGRWHAHIRPEGNAWSIENLHENGTFLNGQPVTGKLWIQSGDSLRLSRDGPEIRVTITREAASAASPAGPGVETPRAAQSTFPTHSGRPLRSWTAWIGLGAMGIALLTLVTVMRGPRFTEDADRPAQSVEMPDSKRTAGDSPLPPGLPGSDESVGTPAAKPLSRSSEPADPWQAIDRRTRGAVFALAAEEPKGFGMWPMGTACAIRKDTLVTTASVATQLESLRREQWKIWALGAAPNSAREISNILVHIGFVKSAEKPKEQSFFDLALLTLSTSVAELCPVASEEEIDALDARQAFGCQAISLPAEDPKEAPEPMGRFDVLAPELTKARIQAVLQLSAEPGAPRMLLLPASMPSQIWGSPVLNAEGNLVAVCTEASQKTETATVRLNYAPVVTSVGEWLQGKGRELWVPPPPAPETRQR